MPRVKAAGKPAQIVPATQTGRAKSGKKKTNGNGDLGFEATLESTADQPRYLMDSSKCELAVLGLIFLKHIADACEENARSSYKRWTLISNRGTNTSPNIFSWAPPDAPSRSSRSDASEILRA
jgi:hypothetical protein